MRAAITIAVLGIAVLLGLGYLLFQGQDGEVARDESMGAAGPVEAARTAELEVAVEGARDDGEASGRADGNALRQPVIDPSSSGGEQTARIEGRVRVDGRPHAGAAVIVAGDGVVTAVTDRRGRFGAGDITVGGEVRVQIEGDVRLPTGAIRRMLLHLETLQLEPGELRRIDVEFVPIALRVAVTDATTGEPVPGARVGALSSHASPFELSESAISNVGTGRATSSLAARMALSSLGFDADVAGEAVAWVSQPGRYWIAASAGGFVDSSRRVTVPESGPADVVRLELRRSVPCAGRLFVPDASAAMTSTGFLVVRSEDGERTCARKISGPDFRFELDGLTEGRYSVAFRVDGRNGRETSFELGPYGDRSLLLDFVPED